MIWYWQAKKVTKGPYIPVKSWHGAPVIDGEEHDRHHRWQCLVRLETTSRMILMGDNVPIDVDGVRLRNIEPITQEEYEHMVRYAAWATVHAPHLPEAQPDTPIDHNKATIPTF